MNIKLKTPIDNAGAIIETITLNLDKLTGADIIAAEKETRLLGDISPNPLFSSQGLAIIGARSAGMISDDIMKLSAPDFMEVTTVVSNFLYGWVLPTLIPVPSER